MFEIGFWELALCLAIVLVVLGPQKLPGVVRTLGRWTGQARGYVRNLTAELEREAARTGIRRELDEARRELKEGAQDLQSALKPPPEEKRPRDD
jgi:sec-independent protein translocase protein TatB